MATSPEKRNFAGRIETILDRIPGVTREQLAMEGITWLTTRSFAEFETREPRLAGWFRELAQKNTALSIATFSVIGAVAGSTFLKGSGSDVTTYFSHFLTAARRALTEPSRSSGCLDLFNLQKTLLTLAPDTSGQLIDWLAGLSAPDRETVNGFLGHLNADEIAQWLILEEPRRLELARLSQTAPEQTVSEDPLLAGLKRFEIFLASRTERRS